MYSTQLHEDHDSLPASVQGSGLAPARLERVLKFIDASLGQPLNIDALAAQAFLSPFHFARMFKISTGLPPHEYITRRRMARARELLATSPLSLREVGAAVGYRTQAHFTGVFRRYVGQTPRQYRAGLR